MDRENTENKFEYIYLVSILETDTNTDIHITSFSGYEYRIIRISICIFHSESSSLVLAN
jgi:hypothetical protein